MKFIELLRPNQWVKQFFVFLPIISLGKDIEFKSVYLIFFAIVSFTSLSGIVYIINDYFDLEQDKTDITRKLRPLASGKITSVQAFSIVIFLLIISISISFLSYNPTLIILISLFYILINSLYSKFHLKNQNLIGIILIGIGFPLRFMFGSIFIDVDLSWWALLLLFELALFILSLKRRQMYMRNYLKLNSNLDEFWLTASVIFASFFASSYIVFISDSNIQTFWGIPNILISSIVMLLIILRVIEIAILKNNSHDLLDKITKDISLYFLSIIYATALLIGRLY